MKVWVWVRVKVLYLLLFVQVSEGIRLVACVSLGARAESNGSS